MTKPRFQIPKSNLRFKPKPDAVEDEEDKTLDLFLSTPKDLEKKLDAARSDEKQFHDMMQDISHAGYIAKQCPQRAEFIVKFMLTHPEEFKRLVITFNDFIGLANKLPHASDAMMQFLFLHPNEFFRLVKSDEALANLAVKFPSYKKFFENKKVGDVVKSLSTNIIEIKIAMLYLIRGSNDAESTLTGLPAEVLVRIAGFLADPEIFSGSSARQIADDQLVSSNAFAAKLNK